MDADELAEAGRVVVTHRLRVAERLQHRVGLDNLFFQRSLEAPDVLIGQSLPPTSTITPFFTSFFAPACWLEPIAAKYEMTFFVFSVLPAPDSPVISIDWFS